MKQVNDIKQNIAAVILAAGKGKRMNSEDKNKVTLRLAGKPIITRIVDFMKSLGIEDIIVVVGYAKDSVTETLEGENIIYAEQLEQKGTGDALITAFKQKPGYITNLLVVYGDDGVIYTEQNKPVIENLFNKHNSTGAAITFLTIDQADPTGLGRIVRDSNGRVTAIVEEKDASGKEREIREINPGCFIFSADFLNKYLKMLTKSKITGEYYLTELIKLAIKDNIKIESIQGGMLAWRGVNTIEELDKAQELMLRSNK